MSRPPRAAALDASGPKRAWLIAALRLAARPLPDALYLRLAHWLYYRRWPDFEQPRSLQEHIQAYYLRQRDPRLVTLADKLAVRHYIESKLGPGFTVPVLGAWARAGDVPLATLSYPLVLKPTHLSGRLLILRAHEPLHEAACRACLDAWLRRDHSRTNREWFYHHVPPAIVAEPLLRDTDGGLPPDIKAYVIGGRVRYFQVDRGRLDRPTRNLYGRRWQLLAARTTLPRHPAEPAPLPLKVMIEAAECLAADFEFLRVDFYVLGAQWLIGELTNSPGAGFGRFYPEAFAEAMAAHWAAPRAARARASIGMNPLQRETTGNAACRK